MMFDFDAAARELDNRVDPAEMAYNEALMRAADLERSFAKWSQVNGGKCAVERSKFRVDLIVDNARSMGVFSALDGTYSIDYNDAIGSPLKINDERSKKSLNIRQLQLAILEWYRRIP